jgi:hypothetical protein
MASWQGDSNSFDVLLCAGADVIKVMKECCTPLFITSWHGHDSSVEALLGALADLCLA